MEVHDEVMGEGFGFTDKCVRQTADSRPWAVFVMAGRG